MAKSDRFPRMLSVDSAKAEKATLYGYLNGINYMAPAETVLSTGKRVNLCSHASPGCIDLCLGKYSGQASMVSDLEHGTNDTRRSRATKAEYFMTDRQAFLNETARHIASLCATAARADLLPCVRLNGSTDIAFEGLRVELTEASAATINRTLSKAGIPHTVAAGTYASLFVLFSWVQFVDYTKNFYRLRRVLPANYWLTLSRSETNEAEAVQALAAGANVAVIFGHGLPTEWNGFPVIDGDTHDLRHLDPRGDSVRGGYVVGLSPKGNKAKKSTSGFVLRNYPMAA